MRFGILGPVEAHNHGRKLRLRAGRERSLLALLLVHPGRLFPPERLVDLLWADPPDSARAQVYNLVSRLRQRLQDPRGRMLAKSDGGYVLVTEPHPLDLAEFRAASGDGRNAAQEGAWERAAEQFTAALGCWRGTALAGCAEPFADSARQDLEEERQRALEGLVDAQLGMGRPDLALTSLAPWLAELPHREDLHRRQMLAFAAQGRTADALAVYRRAYRVLEADLGVEPGPQLKELHQNVLRGTVTLPAPRPASGRSPEGRRDEAAVGTDAARPPGRRRPDPRAPSPRNTPSPQNTPSPRSTPSPQNTPSPRSTPSPPNAQRPRQLPPAPATLCGREDLLSRVHGAVLGNGRAGRVVVLSGQGGAGKTAIALTAGHALADEFPDGQLYGDMRGSRPEPADPHHTAARLLRGLGMDGREIPADPEERVAELRSRLAGRRALLVLDDIRDEAQLRPLLPGTTGCAVVATSRRRLTGIMDAAAVDVGTLTPEDSFALLVRVVGAQRVLAEPEAAREVARLCGYLPLALRIAGARLAARGDWTVGALRDRLASHRRRLDQLTIGDLDVRAGIALSYRALSPPLQTALRRLGMLEARSVPGWVLDALTGEAAAEWGEGPADQLVERHLLSTAGVDQAGQFRFRLHDLVHDFAHERVMAEDARTERDTALERVLHQWLALASRAAHGLGHGGVVDPVVDPVRPPGRGAPAPADVPAVCERPGAWFAAEQANLGDAVRLACRLRLPALASDLALRLDGYLVIRFYEAEREAALRAAIDAWGDTPTRDRRLSHLYFALCWALFQQDRYTELAETARRCWEVASDLGDPEVIADAAWQVGRATALGGRLAEAAEYYRNASREAERLRLSDRARVYARTGLANALADLGDADAAAGHYRDALRRHAPPDRTRVVVLLKSAEASADRLDTSGARQSLDEAARIVDDIGDEVGAAHVERVRGLVELAACDWDRAAGRLRSALAVLRAHRDTSGTALALRSLGDAALGAGRVDIARKRLLEASSVFGRMSAPVEAARTAARLAVVARLAGDTASAEEHSGEYRHTLQVLRLPPGCLRLPGHVRALPPVCEDQYG